MEKKDVLKQLGLSEGESLVYLALLRLGESPVNKIKISTKIHRTTIYDFLDSLIKKGLVGYAVKNNVKYFRSSHPSKLYDLVKEKQENLEEILPELIKMAEFEKKHLKVDIYEGAEGLKTLINRMIEIVRTQKNKEYYGFGFDEIEFENRFPHIMKTLMRREEKYGIKEKLITKKGAEFVYEKKGLEYRYLDQKFFAPVPSVVFGHHVGFMIWEPFTVILIENKDLSEAYKKHFELMWKMADKKP